MLISLYNPFDSWSKKGICINDKEVSYEVSRVLRPLAEFHREPNPKQLNNWDWKSLADSNGCREEITKELSTPILDEGDKEFIFITQRQARNAFYTPRYFISVSAEPQWDFVIAFKLQMKKELNQLLKSEKMEDIIKLHEVCKARDILIVWQILQNQIGGIIDLKLENINSVDELLVRSKDFDVWCRNNYYKLGKISELRLSGKKLTSVPREIVYLQGLQRLFLSSNQLISLPSEIGYLPNLYDLGLANNLLTCLPAAMANLPLWFLNLRNNRLTSIPAFIWQFKILSDVCLSGNQLEEISPEIGQMKHLQHLNVSNNRLTSLPFEVGELTQLETLQIGGNSFFSLPRKMGELPKLEISENELALNLSLVWRALKKLPSDLAKGYREARDKKRAVK
jgi:hypothetical protein